MKKSNKKFRSKCENRLLAAAAEPCRPTGAEIDHAVRNALKRLSFMEREAVERFHFLGRNCREIGEFLQCSEFKALMLLRRGRQKLKALLAPFVEKRLGWTVKPPRCPVCRSQRRTKIEKLLQTKTKEETWKRILRKLKTEFQIQTGARILKAHQKFHRLGSERIWKGISSTCGFRTKPNAAS